jgi:hypothetical protein
LIRGRGKTFYVRQGVQTESGTNPAINSVGSAAHFPGINCFVCEGDYLSLSSVEIALLRMPFLSTKGQIRVQFNPVHIYIYVV